MQSARSLAARDPALAALLGIRPQAVSSAPDFGAEYDDEPTASEFGAEFGSEFGGVDLGAEFGWDDYGADLAPAAVAVANRSFAHRQQMVRAASPASHAQLVQHWNKSAAMAAKSAARNHLLEPNAGSSIKVERYTFAVNDTIVLGVPSAVNATNNPDTSIRPQRLTMNIPAPGFLMISEIKLANVSVSVGGVLDGYQFNSNGVGQTLDCPTLSPANRASIFGSYTGFVPSGYVGNTSYIISGAFTGPATIVA